MENLIFILIVILVIIAIYYMDSYAQIDNTTFSKENFKSDENNNYQNNNTNYANGDILTLNPYHRCKVLGVNKFMVRDLRTKLWLTDGLQDGFSKFLPSRFGVPLLMSDKPDEYLPLRTVADPNDYLLATYNGKGIRVVSNPYNQTFVLQVFIYNGFNVLGYINEGNEQLYIYVDDNGDISSTTEPAKASIIEIIEL